VTSLDGGSGALTNEFTNDWVVAMVKNKIAASIILQQIHSMPTRFDLSTQEIIRLTKAGVSAEILEAMRNPKAAAPSKPAAGKTASGTPATNTQTATAPAANALTAPTPPASSNAPPTTPPPAEKPPALPATQSITIGATMPFSIRLAEDIPANVEPGRTIRFTTVGAFPAEGPTAVAANTALIGEIVDGGKKKPTFRLKDVTAVDGTKLSIHVGGSTPDGRRSFDVPTMARHSQEIAAPAGTGYIAYTQGAQTVTVRSQLSNLPTGGQTVEAPGGPDHLFPYSLALKNRDTGDLKTSGELVEGGYQVVLRMNHDQVASAPKPAQRWVYVLAIGSDGTLKRVFPARENSSLNHLPNGGTPEEIQLEVIMIGEPFGVETLALLASEEPVSPMALEMDSLPGGVDRSRLADFLRQILRANHAGAAPAPDKWSMDLLTFHSVPK
jgi:hypothetical protein